MKSLTAILILLCSFSYGQDTTALRSPYFVLPKWDTCHSIHIMKTNGEGAPATIIDCHGKMLVNDSLESIKQLISAFIKHRQLIQELYDELYSTEEMLAFYNEKHIDEKDVHAYHIALNIYYIKMGRPESMMPCQCEKCLLKNPKNYRKQFHK